MSQPKKKKTFEVTQEEASLLAEFAIQAFSKFPGDPAKEAEEIGHLLTNGDLLARQRCRFHQYKRIMEAGSPYNSRIMDIWYRKVHQVGDSPAKISISNPKAPETSLKRSVAGLARWMRQKPLWGLSYIIATYFYVATLAELVS